MSENRDGLASTAVSMRRIRRPGRRVGLRSAVLAALVQVGQGALACGYEDPNSVMLQRGVLNLSYPNALHVLGALTQARLDGMIPSQAGAPMTSRADAPATKDVFAYQRTAQMLQLFGETMQPAPALAEDLTFSLVLIEPMLWTRFSFQAGEASTVIHTGGPQPGDLVIVSAEAVLRQIVDRSLSTRRAEELGLMRLYGDLSKFALLRAILSGAFGDAAPPPG
jgi:hypothetical protein